MLIKRQLIMNLIYKLEAWGDAHRPVWLDYLRIVLGLFITYKGMVFMTNIEQLQSLIGGYDVIYASIAIAHYVIWVHVLGGPLIALGIFTRVNVILQLPIILGAMILVNYPKGFLSVGNHMELEVSILVFIGLVLCYIFGSGKVSIDELRRKDKPSVHHE